MKKSNVFKGLTKQVIDFIKSIDKKISNSLSPVKPVLIPIDKQTQKKR